MRHAHTKSDVDVSALKEAMLRGDTSACHEIAPCKCCCYEHYFGDCPARLWAGCRGETDISEVIKP